MATHSESSVVISYLQKMDKRIASLESRRENGRKRGYSFSDMRNICTQTDEINDDLFSVPVRKTHHFLDCIAIVGLKEAVKSEHRFLKYTWTFLLCLGIVATAFCLYMTTDEYLENPTATSMRLEDKDLYTFPPMLLCPTNKWFDAVKAFDLGLDLDALKYSLSYPDNLFDHQVMDVDAARHKFLSVLATQKIKTLLDFYTMISPDLEPANSSLGRNPKSDYFCRNGFSDGNLNKTLLDNGLCYVVQLKPIVRGFAVYSDDRAVSIKYTDQTLGLFKAPPDWELYFNPIPDTYKSSYPKLTIRPFSHNTIKYQEQKLIALSTAESPCFTESDSKSYSELSCMAKCHNQLYKSCLNCQLVWLSYSSAALPPTEFCNFLDHYSPKNLTLNQFFDSAENAAIDASAASNCVNECPPACERKIVETTLYLQTISSEAETKTNSNVTTFSVTIKHGAVYQGGVMIITETPTYSAIQWINNVGGTLGLFVGGTIMTFAQLILFIIDYGVRKSQLTMRRVDVVANVS